MGSTGRSREQVRPYAGITNWRKSSYDDAKAPSVPVWSLCGVFIGAFVSCVAGSLVCPLFAVRDAAEGSIRDLPQRCNGCLSARSATRFLRRKRELFSAFA